MVMGGDPAIAKAVAVSYCYSESSIGNPPRLMNRNESKATGESKYDFCRMKLKVRVNEIEMLLVVMMVVVLLVPSAFGFAKIPTPLPSGVSSIVVGGNFSLNGKPTYLAQYDHVSGTWYSSFKPEV